MAMRWSFSEGLVETGDLCGPGNHVRVSGRGEENPGGEEWALWRWRGRSGRVSVRPSQPETIRAEIMHKMQPPQPRASIFILCKKSSYVPRYGTLFRRARPIDRKNYLRIVSHGKLIFWFWHVLHILGILPVRLRKDLHSLFYGFCTLLRVPQLRARLRQLPRWEIFVDDGKIFLGEDYMMHIANDLRPAVIQRGQRS